VKVARRPEMERALAAPDGVRFFLLYGPDEAGSRSLARLLGAAMGADAERVELTGAELKGDPARLADEAASFSMFGGARWILVDPAGDESLPAVEALLDAPAASSPVALVAGALKPASKLLKLALAEKRARAFASYPPDAREADRLVAELARVQGLQLRGDVARRIAESCGGNRFVIAQELAKYALFLDAAPERPRPLDHDAVDAVGAESGEGDLTLLVDSVAGGDPAALEQELARLRAEGQEGIGLLRAVLRRMLLIARLRGDVEAGKSPSAVLDAQGKALFWKDKKALEAQLPRWRADLAARAIGRLLDAERQIKASGGIGPIAADAELLTIARQAQRLR
jgi:DNA polymerase III subunit delta